MAEIKIMAKWLADILGISSVILGFIANLDNIKSAILFLVGLAYVCFRLYFMVIRSRQMTRMKEIEIEIKALELTKLRKEIK